VEGLVIGVVSHKENSRSRLIGAVVGTWMIKPSNNQQGFKK
jgi:hypothetical protein